MISYTIPGTLVSMAREAKWAEGGKSAWFASKDFDSADRSNQKVAVGNIGEAAAYGAFCGPLGIPCEFPNWKKKEKSARGELLWPDDLVFSFPTKLGRKTLLPNQSVKAQNYTVASDYGASWLWQLEDRGRRADPMTSDMDYNCLFIGVLVNDVVPNGDGSVQSDIFVFHWPKISAYLTEPKLDKNKGYKKAIYLEDVKHLEIDYKLLQTEYM